MNMQPIKQYLATIIIAIFGLALLVGCGYLWLFLTGYIYIKFFIALCGLVVVIFLLKKAIFDGKFYF